jgi:pyruvate/2-oxoacid:ferredoxin oxidoreductase alpha subunit
MVDRFLPRRVGRNCIDLDDPRAYGALARPDVYMEMRQRQQEAMEEARGAFDEIESDWARVTGRRWGPIEMYKAEGAELLLVTSGTITSTARYVVDELRERGEAVGLLKVKMFRPFPTDLLRRAMGGVPRVAVLDRNISPGHGGIFAEEIRSALYDLAPERRPVLYGYVVGLGGRDVTPEVIHDIVGKTRGAPAPQREDLWVGVKP